MTNIYCLAVISLWGERETAFIIQRCDGTLASGLACASLTHYTVCPVGRRCAGRGAVMVCATTMERGHRRETGVDVCWGVGWVALQQGAERRLHSITVYLVFWYFFQNSPYCKGDSFRISKQSSKHPAYTWQHSFSKQPNAHRSKVDLWLHQMSKNIIAT